MQKRQGGVHLPRVILDLLHSELVGQVPSRLLFGIYRLLQAKEDKF
jgi:hypothetical protein